MSDAVCDVRCERVSFKLLLWVGVVAVGADVSVATEPVVLLAIGLVKTVEVPVSLPPST